MDIDQHPIFNKHKDFKNIFNHLITSTIEDTERLLIAAIPTVYWQQLNKDSRKVNPYDDLSDEGREVFESIYGDYSEYQFIIYLTQSLTAINNTAKTILDIYTASTTYIPYAIDMDDLIHYIFTKTLNTTSILDAHPVETTAFLIIRNFMGNFNRLDKVSGDIKSLLSKRLRDGRVTILIDQMDQTTRDQTNIDTFKKYLTQNGPKVLVNALLPPLSFVSPGYSTFEKTIAFNRI